MCAEGERLYVLWRSMTLRTYDHGTPQRYVVEQANYSGLHYAPDQEQGDTCIKFYEVVIHTD